MDSSEVLQLLAHNIEHPKLVEFLAQYQMSESFADRGWHHYQNPDKTLQLDFCSCTPKAFNKDYMQPVIDRFGNPVRFDKDLKRKERLFLTLVTFSQGFTGALPFNLSLNMDEASISETLQAAPIEIIDPIICGDDSAREIDYHICPYMLNFCTKEGEQEFVLMGFTWDWQVEVYNLYEQYPRYGKRKKKTRTYKEWRLEQQQNNG